MTSQQSRVYLTPEQQQWIAATLIGGLILMLTLKGLSGNPTGQALFAFTDAKSRNWTSSQNSSINALDKKSLFQRLSQELGSSEFLTQLAGQCSELGDFLGLFPQAP